MCTQLRMIISSGYSSKQTMLSWMIQHLMEPTYVWQYSILRQTDLPIFGISIPSVTDQIQIFVTKLITKVFSDIRIRQALLRLNTSSSSCSCLSHDRSNGFSCVGGDGKLRKEWNSLSESSNEKEFSGPQEHTLHLQNRHYIK